MFIQFNSCGSCDATCGTAMTLVNLVATLFGLFLVDVIGRRKFIIGGLLILFVSIFTMIFCITVSYNNLGLLMLIIVVFGGAVGPGVGIWLVYQKFYLGIYAVLDIYSSCFKNIDRKHVYLKILRSN